MLLTMWPDVPQHTALQEYIDETRATMKTNADNINWQTPNPIPSAASPRFVPDRETEQGLLRVVLSKSQSSRQLRMLENWLTAKQ